MKLPSLKTNKKPTKSKAKVGSGSSKKKRPLAKVGFLSLAAVLFVTSVGYGGFAFYKQRELKNADAAGWLQLRAYPERRNEGWESQIIWARACKTYIPNTFYGPLYKVTLQVYRNSNFISRIRASAWRYDGNGNKSKVNQVYQSGWLYGVVAGLDNHMSAQLNDVMTFHAETIYGHTISLRQGDEYRIFPRALPNC